VVEFKAIALLNTDVEVNYFRNGGSYTRIEKFNKVGMPDRSVIGKPPASVRRDGFASL